MWEEEDLGSSTGILEDADVDGLRSWDGEGARLREADWSVDANSMAGLEAIVRKVSGEIGEGVCSCEVWFGDVDDDGELGEVERPWAED